MTNMSIILLQWSPYWTTPSFTTTPSLRLVFLWRIAFLYILCVKLPLFNDYPSNATNDLHLRSFLRLYDQKKIYKPCQNSVDSLEKPLPCIKSADIEPTSSRFFVLVAIFKTGSSLWHCKFSFSVVVIFVAVDTCVHNMAEKRKRNTLTFAQRVEVVKISSAVDGGKL